MDGYKSIFDEAQTNFNANENILHLKKFRYMRHLYGFCINEGGVDNQALDYAKEINSELCHKFIDQPKGLTGYKDNEEKYLKLDDLDCKHILQLTFLFNHYNSRCNQIVEIGGGFGNMNRLCKNIIDYTNWDIIDIPHISLLQKYYLENELNDISNVHFIDTNNTIDYKNVPIDLVIANHSLSELSWDYFYFYFNNVIKYSNHLYFGFNKFCPSKELIDKKIEYIETNGFILEKKFEYTEHPHGANVSYSLYKHANY
jgi:hypothetical protein